MSLTNICTVLYKNKPLSNGKYAVRLRLYFGKEHFISLGESALPSEWNEKTGRFNSRAENQEARNVYLIKKEKEAREIIAAMSVFSYEEFKKKFKGVSTSFTVSEFLDDFISELKQKGDIGNSNKYTQLKQMLERFKQDSITFADITYVFLTKFEAFILGRGNAKITAHFYMRTLRSMWNHARKRGYVDLASYPFKNTANPDGYSFSHLKGGYNPKPLPAESLQKLGSFDRNEYPQYALSYDIWVFSLFTNGANCIDVLLARHDKNIVQGRFVYDRQKTKRRYSIKIHPVVDGIIKRYAGGTYIFPVMETAPKDKVEQYKYIRLAERQVNKDMNRIAKILGIPEKITTYTARYTYTDILIKQNAPLTAIQQKLGHEDISTTQHYYQKHTQTEMDDLDELITM